MIKSIYTVFYFLFVLTLVSCREDKGNESMPVNKIRGVYEPQLNYLNEALEDDPDDDELLFKRAQVLMNLYRYSEALHDIKSAVSFNSSKPEYYLVLSQVHFSLGNYFESIKASEKAESLGLDNPELTVMQARVYWETGDTARCLFYMNRAAQIVPFHSGIQLLKGKQASAKGDTAQAVTFYLSSVRSDRTNIDAYRDLIKIYLNRGKEDSAMYYTIQAKALNLHHADFYYTEGRIFYRKDMKQSAIACYKYSLTEDSGYAPSIYQLGQLYYNEGNPVEAFNYFKRYTTLNDDKKDVYVKLISILTEQNKESASIPYLERLIQLDSTNIGLKYRLQKLYNQYSLSDRKDTVRISPVVNPSVRIADTVRRRSFIVRKDSSAQRTNPPVVNDTTAQ